MIYIEKELDDLKKEVLEMWDLVNSQLNRAGDQYSTGYFNGFTFNCSGYTGL